MIINKKENFTSFINPDTSILANHMDFSIIQHAYFEFSDEVIAIHHNKNFLNTNLLYYIFEGGGTTFFNDEEIPILPGKIYFHPCVQQKEYKSVKVYVTLGGPNVWIDTATACVHLAWCNERCEYPLSYDVCDEIDTIFEEYYNMM